MNQPIHITLPNLNNPDAPNEPITLSGGRSLRGKFDTGNAITTPYDAAQAHYDMLLRRAQARQEKCHFAVHLAVKKGIAGVCRFNPVLDVGCRNPYLGMYHFLKRFNWAGQYIGLDTKIPPEVIDWYKNDITVKAWAIQKDRWPLPPSSKRPFIDISVAYAVDTFQRFDGAEKDYIVSEMQRVSACSVIVGGVNEAELRRWGFQRIGYNDFGSVPEFWGVWLHEKVESMRHRMDMKAPSVIGIFDTSDPKEIVKRLYNCERCGKTEISGNRNFECKHCGHINRERIRLDVTA